MSESKRSPQSSGSASGGASGTNGTDRDGAGSTSSSSRESSSKESRSEASSHRENHHQSAHSSGKGSKRIRERERIPDKEESRREREQNRKMFTEEFWDCSICTFRNKAEAFICGVCDARKGTSTRKPRINPAQLVVAQQVAQQPKPKRKREQNNKKLKNIDRNNDIQTAITVNGLTVVITEFKPKAPSRKRTVSENSNGSSDGGATAQQSDEEFEALPSGTSAAEKSSP
ncbi:YY1-associated factor 2 [Galendromus occidentalis]|uniref:YY1-associated factor 2 n=1 Tax=Galendromus occidentalis TaxID=34638 RepID=A0AAJ6QRK6_9ACAR|nr:YY1-associated factor 2 [Galendromus occidentalis]